MYHPQGEGGYMITAKSISNTIINYCEKMGLSQRALAFKVGVSPQTMNCWIRGLKNPSVKSLERLQEVIGKLEEE